MAFRLAIYESDDCEVLLGKPYSGHSIESILSQLLESRQQFYVKRTEKIVIEKLENDLWKQVNFDDF